MTKQDATTNYAEKEASSIWRKKDELILPYTPTHGSCFTWAKPKTALPPLHPYTPTMTWNRNEPFVREKPIVAFAHGIETPNSVMLSNTRVTANAQGKKVVPEGMFICRMGSEFHCLPRANVTTAFSTGAATGVINLPQIFQPGDILTTVEAYITVTFSGSWTTSGTVQLTLPNGSVRSFNIGAGGATAVTVANVATIVANAINDDPIASGLVFAIASGAVVYIYNRSGEASSVLTLASATNASDVAVASVAPYSSIGTILLVNTNGTITLTGNAARNVPVGAHIGVVVDEIYGVYPHALDLTNKPAFAVAPVSGAHGIYETALPYVDGDIKRRLPKLKIAVAF